MRPLLKKSNVEVVNYLRINADSKKIFVLALLDLIAAFDTVDHDILMNRLENYVGLAGPFLNWFRTYLAGQEYFVALGDHSSKSMLSRYTPSTSLRSSGNELLTVPKARTKKHVGAAFSFYAPSLWNTLPEDLRMVETVESFKHDLKTCL